MFTAENAGNLLYVPGGGCCTPWPMLLERCDFDQKVGGSSPHFAIFCILKKIAEKRWLTLAGLEPAIP